MPSGSGSPASFCDVSLVSEPRLAKMHLIVDYARNDVLPRSIENVGITFFVSTRREYFCDMIVFNNQIGFARFSFVDDCSAFD